MRGNFRDLRVSHGLLVTAIIFGGLTFANHFPWSAVCAATALALVVIALFVIPRLQTVLVITEDEVAVTGRRPQPAARAEIAAIRVSLDDTHLVNQETLPLISFGAYWHMPKYRGLASQLGVPPHDNRPRRSWEGDTV
jgi:hypothetical protein